MMKGSDLSMLWSTGRPRQTFESMVMFGDADGRGVTSGCDSCLYLIPAAPHRPASFDALPKARPVCCDVLPCLALY